MILSAPVKSITLAELRKRGQDDKDKLIARLRSQNLLLEVKFSKAESERNAARADVTDLKSQIGLEKTNTKNAEKALSDEMKANVERREQAAKDALAKRFLTDQNTELKKDKTELEFKLRKARGRQKYYALGGAVVGFAVCSQSSFIRN